MSSRPTDAEVASAVRAGKDEVEEILSELVSVPSVVGKRTRVGSSIARRLRAIGMKTESIDGRPSQIDADPEWSPFEAAEPLPNVIGSWGGAAARTMLFAHIDTEAPGDDGAWSTDPFVATRRGPRVYGLGAADDKGGVASAIGALSALDRLGIRPPGLRAAFVQGKGGGSGGALPVWRALATEPLDEAAAAIYCHPAETGRGLADLKAGSRGLLTVRIEITGRTPAPAEERTPASADPGAGHNAVELAAPVIEASRTWPSQAGGPGARLTVTSVASPSAAPFTVPDRCTLRVGLWFTRGTVAEIEADYRKHLLAALATHPWLAAHPPTITTEGLRANPARTDGRSRLVRLVSDAVEAIDGQRPTAYRGHAASDIRFPIRCAGIPAVGLGATGGGFYGPDEWVDVPSMHRTTATLVRAVLALSDGSPR